MTILAQTAPFANWADYWDGSWMIWLSAFCVLGIYSYLFKDNAVYRSIVQMSVGIGIGYSVKVLWQEVLYPQWWLPMNDGYQAAFHGAPGSPWGLMWLVVGLLGLLWYFQLSRKYIWLSRFVIGITVGIGAGLTFKSQFGQNIPQVVDSFRPLAPSVVGPQPVKRFVLPPTTVPPALSEPVVFFANDSQVTCVEILNGVEVWKTPIAAKPVHALRVDGDDLIVPTHGTDLIFDKNTGVLKGKAPNFDGSVIAILKAGDKKIEVRKDRVTGFDAEIDLAGKAVSSACVMPKVADVEGKERDLVMLVVDGKPVAYEAPSGKPVWAKPTQMEAETVFNGGRVGFAVRNGTVKTFDPNTGDLLANIALKDEVSMPCIARMPQPTQDQVMAVVAIGKTSVAAAMSRPDPATARDPGEVLWRYDTRKPILWTGSVDGVFFTAGPDGGACYEVPVAQPKLQAQDYTDNWMFVVALLSVMTYFFFSFKQRSAKGVAAFSKIGRWTLMIGFGAIFGNTIMSRMSFLLDRFMFLNDEWIMPLLRMLGLPV